MTSSESGVAADVLWRSRHAAGLTQSQLAELAGTSQSAIAAYESGTRQPTLPVLVRMVEASGHVVRVTVDADPGLFRIADLAHQIRAAGSDAQRQLRLVFEFLRVAEQDGHPLVLLVAAEPESTGDSRFDALLAAAAEDLCVQAGIAPPAWVHDPSRFLEGAWWVSNLPSGRAQALVHAPASYRRRGVMIDRHDLEAA
jgi:transcriptional regulator with XRE-family HTH domain